MKIKKIISNEDLKHKGIGACRKVAELEYQEGKIIYIAQTPQTFSYNGFRRNTTRAYICDNNNISLLFSNISNHRAKKAIRAYNNGDVGTIIPTDIWNNYITNGYNTRRGLYANYESKIKKIKQIAQSHADYMGNETWNSRIDHYNRMSMRQH